MNSSIQILKEIVHWLEEYQSESPKDELNLDSFILWLNSRLFSENHTEESQNSTEMLDMELSFMLVMQSRYYKAYAKRVLGDSELTSPDGFSFLYHLSLVESYRKMELIKKHHLEPPSGIEILKRLMKKGLIQEFDDVDDKRAKRISITKKGKKELQLIMPRMSKVFRLMTADMSLNEKLHVLAFLKQMNDFHASSISKT
jgi:MarR family transcriptional regulator, lower aerobic nicotinate degradation pathway regulator